MAAAIISAAHAQLLINTAGVPVNIDFTGFSGAGFQPGGGGGTLNSNEWSATGFSDGASDFGATSTTGDFARGSTTGLVTTGGIYAVDIAGNQGLMVQPTADDFTPGSFILKIENNTGVDVTELSLSYTIYVLNDGGRSNSFNFAVSYDNVTYSPVADLDYATPEMFDFTPYVIYRSTSITGLSFTDGSVLYLSWTGNDISGTGTRDEIALDDIAITAIAGAPTPLATFSPAGDIADEGDGFVTAHIMMTESTDCLLNIAVGAGGTADAADVTFTEFGLLLSPGDPLDYPFDIPIIDDATDELDETFILELSYVSGTCAVGLPSSYTLLITDNDDTPPPTYTAYDIAEVNYVDANGVVPTVGTNAELTGVAHGINTWDGGLQFTLIDATGGISVFSFDNTFGYTVTEGDELTIQGVISQFNGLCEIEPDTLWFVDAGNPLQTPALVTVLSEATESQMTTINGLQYVDIAQWLGDGSSFNVDLTDGVNTYTIRIDDDNELSTLPAPSSAGLYELNVTGIGGQYDTGMPYLDGYQLFPRYASDITVVTLVGIDDPVTTQVSLYPNPATDMLNLTSDTEIGNIVIRDVTGTIVYAAYTADQTFTLPVNDWAQGTYMIQLTNNTATDNMQFVKL